MPNKVFNVACQLKKVVESVRPPYTLLVAWLIFFSLSIWWSNDGGGYFKHEIQLGQATYVCNSTIGSKYTLVYVESLESNFYKSSIIDDTCGYVELDLSGSIDVEYMGNILISVTSNGEGFYRQPVYDVLLSNIIGGLARLLMAYIPTLALSYMIIMYYRINYRKLD